MTRLLADESFADILKTLFVRDRSRGAGGGGGGGGGGSAAAGLHRSGDDEEEEEAYTIEVLERLAEKGDAFA